MEGATIVRLYLRTRGRGRRIYRREIQGRTSEGLARHVLARTLLELLRGRHVRPVSSESGHGPGPLVRRPRANLDPRSSDSGKHPPRSRPLSCFMRISVSASRQTVTLPIRTPPTPDTRISAPPRGESRKTPQKGRDGGVLGLGGRRPSQLSMNTNSRIFYAGSRTSRPPRYALD